MQQRMRAARENEKGFTLIELLIVIVILGILAGIVVFSVQFIQNRGAAAACNTDAKQLQSAAEAYYAQHSAYPPTAQDMVNDGELHSLPAITEVEYAIGGATGYTITPHVAGCNA